jgi:starvation-inducible DNA-binding protein
MLMRSQIQSRCLKDLPSHRANRAEISAALTALLPDMFALYLETKNFDRHVSGLQLGDCHLLLDDQAAQILATTDLIAERVKKLGGCTITYIGHIGQLRPIENDADEVAPGHMLAELLKHNRRLANHMQQTRALCEERGDVVSARLVENWIDEAEGRAWFLRDAVRTSERVGQRLLGTPKPRWDGHLVRAEGPR